MRRLVGLLGLVVTLCGIGIIPTGAQSPDWQAWLYNAANGHMVLVSSDNVVDEDFTLPGLQGNDYSYRVVVSPDGSTIAYTLFNTFNQIHSVYVYSTVTDSLLTSYVIPSQQGQLVYNSIELSPNSQMFSPDGRSIAFGYTIENVWSLVVLDLVNQPGTVLLQLNSTDPAMSSVERIALDVPVVMNYDGTNIDFIIIPAGTEGLPNYPHYTYNTSTGTLKKNYYFTVPGGDFSQRDGRYVFSISDYRLPNESDSYQGFGQQINAIHVWRPNTTETYPIFNAPNRSLFRVNFIQNAEKLLTNAYNWSTSKSEWWIVEQTGNVQTTVTSLTDVYPSGIEGVGDGFVMSVNTNDVAAYFPELQTFPDRSALLDFDTRAANNGTASRYVWVSGENQEYVLVDARDNLLASRPAPNLWTPIGDPANASNFGTLSVYAEQITQPTSNTLQIGGQARIFTTEGDRANMRSGPGTNFSVVQQLDNDTIVTILEGPQTSGGFTWWRVQSAGNSGWVVESADSVRVLQPMGSAIPTLVPTTAPVNPPSTLTVGGFAMVTADGNNLNARQQPTTTSGVVATYQTNERFSIIGGPITAGGFTWWQINTQFGPAWVAEGNATEKWIVPSS